MLSENPWYLQFFLQKFGIVVFHYTSEQLTCIISKITKWDKFLLQIRLIFEYNKTE